MVVSDFVPQENFFILRGVSASAQHFWVPVAAWMVEQVHRGMCSSTQSNSGVECALEFAIELHNPQTVCLRTHERCNTWNYGAKGGFGMEIRENVFVCRPLFLWCQWNDLLTRTKLNFMSMNFILENNRKYTFNDLIKFVRSLQLYILAKWCCFLYAFKEYWILWFVCAFWR